MNRREANMWRTALPIVFWTVGIGGSLVPAFVLGFTGLNSNYYWGYAVAALLLMVIAIFSRIKRHDTCEVQCFWLGLTLAVASYWMPTVLFFVLPFWIVLISRNVFTVRAIVATLVGVGFVAIYAAIAVWLGWITNVWASFFSPDYLWAGIPVGAILSAWLDSTIAKKTIRVR